MFNFRKAKKSIHDWANDVTADNDRMIKVLSKILVPLSDITKYWKEDPAYIESNKKVIAFTGDLYAFGNITKFFFNLLFSNAGFKGPLFHVPVGCRQQ